MSLFVIHVGPGGSGRIIKDGVDISNEIVGFTVAARVGHATEVELIYAGAEVDALLDTETA